MVFQLPQDFVTADEDERDNAAQADEVFFALYGPRTELVFIDEYLGQFEALRDSDLEQAENMLFHLRGTTDTAVSLFNDLVGLLLAGKTLDLGKPLPRELRLTRRRERPADDCMSEGGSMHAEPGAAGDDGRHVNFLDFVAHSAPAADELGRWEAGSGAMVEPRIGRVLGHEIAFAAACAEAEKQLTPRHWALWSSVRCPARYEIAPHADEWEPVLGFAPDDRSYLEYGYMLPDESGRHVPVCRVLVDRRVSGSVTQIEWYPTRIDPRKRPD